MTDLPTIEIPELEQSDINEFRLQHFPDELYVFIKANSVESMNRLKEYIENNNDLIGKKKKFSKYITLIKNYYNSFEWQGLVMLNAFLAFYSFCDDNKILTEEFANLVKENLEPFRESLIEG